MRNVRHGRGVGRWLAVIGWVLIASGPAWAVEWLQPAAPPRTTQPPPPQGDSLDWLLDQPPAPVLRLAGIPNMFGDSLLLGGQLFFDDDVATGTADFPLAGASRRMKAAENNQAVPQDRVYFTYNHFHNALVVDTSEFVVDPARRVYSIDRYAFGVEKTFGDLWSVGLWMPFAGRVAYDTTNFSLFGGEVGNLSVLVKRLVYQSDTMAASIGLGIDTPTGSDVRGIVNEVEFAMRNQAVHLMPFVGLTGAPRPCLFYHAFLQIDVPANGNRVDFDDFNGPGVLGVYNEQTLMYFDVAVGRWLYRNPRARFLTGLAALVEVHYATPLQDADVVEGTFISDVATEVRLTRFANRFNEVNLTTGLHAEFFGNTLCRVAGVFPLATGDDRSFDAEVQVQLERRF